MIETKPKKIERPFHETSYVILTTRKEGSKKIDTGKWGENELQLLQTIIDRNILNEENKSVIQGIINTFNDKKSLPELSNLEQETLEEALVKYLTEYDINSTSLDAVWYHATKDGYLSPDQITKLKDAYNKKTYQIEYPSADDIIKKLSELKKSINSEPNQKYVEFRVGSNKETLEEIYIIGVSKELLEIIKDTATKNEILPEKGVGKSVWTKEKALEILTLALVD